MEQKRILELVLEALQKRKAAPTAGFKGKRSAKTPAERKAQSKRMKVGWAAGGSESENDGSLEPQELIEER